MHKLILTKLQRQYIIDLEKYIIDYCDKNNYNITINYILNVNYINFIYNNDDIFDFTIIHNDNRYNYVIKLLDDKFVLEQKNND